MHDQLNDQKQVVCQLSIQVDEKDEGELSNAIKEIQNAKKRSIKSMNRSPTTDFINNTPSAN